LLPFVPILKGGKEQSVVRTALRELRANEELSELEPLLSFFASFVLELPVIQEIMRWDMAVLMESPWYQQILQEGLQKGLQEGEQRGEQRGRLEGRLAGEVQLVLRQLNRRVGLLDETLQQQITRLSLEQLEALAEELLDFSGVEELQTWLAQQ
jgi:predicted transposase YdaD